MIILLCSCYRVRTACVHGFAHWHLQMMILISAPEISNPHDMQGLMHGYLNLNVPSMLCRFLLLMSWAASCHACPSKAEYSSAPFASSVLPYDMYARPVHHDAWLTTNGHAIRQITSFAIWFSSICMLAYVGFVVLGFVNILVLTYTYIQSLLCWVD